jgi:hypothetical protein
MISFFLKAKHWQLFLLTFGPVIAFYVYMISNMFEMAQAGGVPQPVFFADIFTLMPIVILSFTLTLFAWYWSVVNGLKALVPSEVDLKLGHFKVFFWVPLIYIFLISVGLMIGLNASRGFENPPQLATGLIVVGAILVVLLHLFSIFCILHTYYFTAKVIRSAETKMHLRTSDFIGEFFLIWFFPIGVWFLQPKVNKLYAERQENPERIA